MSRLRKAMDRARAVREGNEGGFKEPAEAGALASAGAQAETEPLKEVNPAYHQTRVEEASSAALRRNKVLSQFHESEIADRVGILRTQVLNKMEELGGNSLLITSANPREGKTFTAVNLAVSLCHEVNRTTLLVDADLRKPEVLNFFGLEAIHGLSDYLLGRADIPSLLINPGIPKLTLLPGGNPLPNSAELLGAPRMESLAKEMKDRYSDRFLIFDSTSILTRADAQVLSRFVDGVIFVVEAERTSAKDIDRALGLLRDRPLVGTVYNKAR